MYSGYLLKFNLYAKHAIFIESGLGEMHPHTWSIALYINTDGEYSEFYKIEQFIEALLDEYQNKNFNEIPPFDVLNPTLENIGTVLFNQIELLLQEKAIKIDKMEISETPARIYVVRGAENTKKDSGLPSNVFLNSMVRYVAESILSEEDKNKQDHKIAKKAPQKVAEEEHEVVPDEPKMDVMTEGVPYRYKTLKIIAAILSIFVLAAGLVYYINLRGNYPWGSDTYGHIFKGDLLYKNILQGNYYPLYTDLWYNGIQPFRYWAPIPYYLFAAFEFVSNGNPITAYNIYVAFCFIAGSFGWLLWGVKEKKILLATSLGVLWFCLPDNIRVFFSEGNVPRVIIALLLPYILYFIWQYVEHRKNYAMIPVILLMALISLCHLMIAAMLGITIFIFMFYYGFRSRSPGRALQIIIGLLFGISICGVWLYPALQGGLLSLDQEAVAEVMKALTFPFKQSLNPSLRFSNIEIYYFGLSIFIIAALGILLSNKKSSSAFMALITVFLGTTTAFVPFLIKMPLNQLLWMMRFTPIAYGIFFIGLLTWKKIRRYVMLLFILALTLDSGLSFKQLAFNTNPPADTVNMLNETIAATSQRVAIMDLSEFGSFPSFYLCAGNNETQYAYGWAWQGASTAPNIVLLNTALEKEYYGYMFDRCLELGCDTVLVKKDKVKDLDKLSQEAARSQYQLIKEFNIGYLYKADTPKSFGMTVKYSGLAIGKTAANIVLDFPCFQIGNESRLDAYTLDELCQYDVIYISDFTYKDKKTAETLIHDAADRGVKFVVDMNRVPNDPITNRLTFLGVTAQPIQFENKLPDLYYSGHVYFPSTFKEEFKKWNTIYLDGVPSPRGFSWFGGNKLVFIGEDKNPNITFIGFNLLYHGIVNQDNGVKEIFSTVMGKMLDTLPERKIVPIEVTKDRNKIIIQSEESEVDTTLAYLDAFRTTDNIGKKHNLLFVNQPKTEISITYPYMKEGVAVSGLGICGSFLFLYFVVTKRKGSR